MGSSLGQNVFHKEPSGRELEVEPRGCAIASRNLGLGSLDHAAPHIAQRDEAEEIEIVGCTCARIVRLGQRVLHEPDRGLLQMAQGRAQGRKRKASFLRRRDR